MVVINDLDVGADATFLVCEEIDIHFPTVDNTISQDREFCIIKMDGVEKKIRFHDYHEIFSIPLLYEKIFYEHLKCCSPKMVCESLKKVVQEAGVESKDLSVLEIGAGNGMVGEELRLIGIPRVVGIDILIEAKIAAYRDRSHVYEDYFVVDLTDVPETIEKKIRQKKLNTLVSVAALGFDDLPPRAYAEAFNMIEKTGWIAFNIKDAFLSENDPSGFSRLIRNMIRHGIVTVREQKKYQHRVAIDETPLYYYAIVGRKNSDIPNDWLEQL